MTNKKGDSQSSSSNDKPTEAKNRGWPKGKRRYPKVNSILRLNSIILDYFTSREQVPLSSPSVDMCIFLTRGART